MPDPVDHGDAPLITGVGLVTPLGASAWATAAALLAGRTTADRIGALAEAAGPVDPTMLARATAGSPVSGLTLTDPAVELAERAAREAIADAGAPCGAPAVIASSKGAVVSLLDREPSGRRHAAAALGPHAFLAAELRRRLGVGETATPVAACATSIAALVQAAAWIRAGAERVVVIAVESALQPLFVESYRRLGAMAPPNPAQRHRCLALDEGRCGFTLNESAAAVVLERAVDPARRAWARLDAVAAGAQPFDPVRAAPDFTTLERLAGRVLGAGGPPALIQPHATGTPDNDERELRALEAALRGDAPGVPLYAAKGAIGHSLGAAGLVNVVLSCLFMRTRRVPPMPWLRRPIPTAFSLGAEPRRLERGRHLCVASGFGGHVGAAVIGPAD